MTSSTLRPGPSTTRQRLPASTRVQAILDAALEAFSRHGYNDAHMDDIALRAQLSKGGLYAHFDSKERLLEAVLARTLVPPALDPGALLAASRGLRDLLERLSAILYDHMADPRTLAAMRLLIAESERVPALARQWQRDTGEHVLQAVQALLQQAARKGWCRPGITVEQPWLAVAPLVHALTARLVLGPADLRTLEESRRQHVEMLWELLSPDAAARSSSPLP